MNKVLALLIAASLTLAAHAAPLSTVQVDGVLNRPGFDDLHDPGAGNALQPWMGRSFVASLSWTLDSLLAVDLDGNDEHERVWALGGLGSMVVDGYGTVRPDLTYVAVQRSFVYDGSAGILPAGTYEVLSLSGAHYCTAASGEPYFGECVTDVGVRLRHQYAIDLIGSAGMLGGPVGALPLASDIRTDRVLAVLASFDLFADNTHLIGGLASVNTGTDRLSHLRLTTLAVPEPASAALCLLGLAALGLRRRAEVNPAP